MSASDPQGGHPPWAQLHEEQHPREDSGDYHTAGPLCPPGQHGTCTSRFDIGAELESWPGLVLPAGVGGGLSEGGEERAARCHYPLPRSLKRLPESPALSSSSIISAPGALSQRGWNPGLGRTCWRMFKPLVGAARCHFKIFPQAAERAWSVLLRNSDSLGTRGCRRECRTFPSITEPRPPLALQAGSRVAEYPSWWQVSVWILASPWGLYSRASRSASHRGTVTDRCWVNKGTEEKRRGKLLLCA